MTIEEGEIARGQESEEGACIRVFALALVESIISNHKSFSVRIFIK